MSEMEAAVVANLRGDREEQRTAPDGLAWQRSYRREDVDRFIADVEAEKARLLAQIADAEARIERARAAAAPSADVEAALGAVVLQILREQEVLEREHEATIERVRVAAEEGAARRVAEARREVSEIRRTTESLLTLVGGRPTAEDSGELDGARPVGRHS